MGDCQAKLDYSAINAVLDANNEYHVTGTVTWNTDMNVHGKVIVDDDYQNSTALVVQGITAQHGRIRDLHRPTCSGRYPCRASEVGVAMTSVLKAQLGLTCFALCSGLVAIGQGFNLHYDPGGQSFMQGAWNIESSGAGWLVYMGSYEPDTITPDNIVGNYIIILQKIAANGQVEWTRKHKVTQHALGLGWANCCDSVTGGGGISGGSIVNSANEFKIRLMRYGPDGDTLWTREFGDATHYWSGNSVRETNDGGFLMTGFTDAIGYEDGFVIKTDALGNEEWRQTYGLGGEVKDGILSAGIFDDGFILGGTTFPTFENSDLWVQRIDDLGDVIWTIRWGTVYDEPPAYVELLSEGTIAVASAWGYASDGAITAFYLAKLDVADGSIIWDREYDDPGYGEFFTAIKEFPNSDLIACGVTYEGGHEQGVLLRTTTDGDSLWMRNYWYYDSLVAQGQGRFWDVLPTADGGCIATGFANAPFEPPFPPGISQDSWVVKVDSMGCVVPGCNGVGITEVVTNLGGALRLYPNPVHNQLHVGVSLPANYTTHGPLTLTVTSLAGQVVLQEQVPTSAPEEVVLDVTDLASGMYSIHLSDANTWIAGERFVVE